MRLQRRARRLEYATTAWNLTEAVVAISTGLAAHSLGLVAFGLDSCVEVFASLVVLWQLRERESKTRSRQAIRLIAGAFAALAVYLAGDAIHGLLARAEPRRSVLGLAFLAVTVAVMFALATGKRRVGTELRNRALLANASLTFLDGILAAGILVAVVVAVELGWWWADPMAAALVAVMACREAINTWRGDGPAVL